ncbi:MAG: AAA family ATPase [Alphaproteobacteria bacterium]|nr:AAA family ATPase [Alphaproteobacteria bacterium]
MQITLKNVGAIQSAAVSLNGLAVIAGPNESGKTTVGKTLYTVIKALKEHRGISSQDKIRSIRQSFVEISSIVSKTGISPFDGLELFGSKNSINSREKTDLSEFLYKITMARDTVPDELESVLQDEKLNKAMEIVDIYRDILSNNLSENNKELALRYIDGIVSLIKAEPTFAESFKAGLLKMYRDIFSGQITNIYTNETSEVSINEGLKYKIPAGLGVFEMEDIDEQMAKQAIFFTDATFIESPLIIQYGIASNYSPHYWKDLIKKLRNKPESDKISSLLNNEIHKLFTNEIKGELDYNANEKDFVITKPNAKPKLAVNNAASGTKEFGILQRMARLELFSGANLIILDEPENHLHTAWQVKLAEIIIKLVKNGISILITSHSPDFIQTLRIEADKEKLDSDKARFYLSEKVDVNTEVIKYDIVDKTGKEADILENLSKPMDDIYKYIMQNGPNSQAAI